MLKRLKIMKYAYLVVFLMVCGYLVYFNLFESRSVAANSYNRRLRNTQSNIIRGSIMDRNGDVLAKSYKVNSRKAQKPIQREYVYGRTFSHIIGYSSEGYGSSGLEAFFNKELMTSDNTIENLKSKANGYYINGNNIRLTLDKTLQQYASTQLKGKKGSIVVLNPRTGEVLAMVSKPDFDPSDINDAGWEKLVADEDSPLLNRATDGLYPPGSIFKVVVAASILENNLQDTIVDCVGKTNIEGYEIKDNDGTKHGEIGFGDAFSKSCNSFFINLGLKLGINNLYNETTKFKFNKTIPSDIKITQSAFPIKNDQKSVAQQSIGQGDVLITPMHAALIAATVANKGVMMEPYCVDSIIGADSKVLKIFKPKQIGTVIAPGVAEQLTAMMADVVKSGTGTQAKSSKYKVAGKTGTAQIANGKAHAWFIGFAPADDPQIAIAVLVENGGSGGSTAAPIAGRIIKKALSLSPNW